MKYLVTSVYDTVALTFKAPQLALNENVAVRDFRYACQNVSGVPVEDIELFVLGHFDETTGTFELNEHKLIARGSDYIQKGE